MAQQIGDATVEVWLDGDNPKSRAARKKIEQQLRKDAKKYAKTYNKAFSKVSEDEQKRSGMRIMGIVESQPWDKMGQRAGRKYGTEMATYAQNEVERRMRAGKIPIPGLDSADLEGSFIRLEKTLNAELDRIADKRIASDARANEIIIVEREKALKKMIDTSDQILRDGEREMIASFKRVASAEAGLAADRARRFKADRKAELSDWDAAFKELDKQAKDSAAERLKAEKDAAAEALQLQKNNEKDFLASYGRLGAAHAKMVDGKRNRNTSYNDSIKETITHLRGVRTQLEDMPDFEAERWGMRREFIDNLDDWERSLIRISPRLHLFNRRMGTMGDRIGRAFGRGSRNDVVNFFGGLVQGGFRMVALLPRMAEGIYGFSRSFTSLAKSDGIFSALMSTIKGGSGGMAAFGSAMVSAAVAIPIVVVVVGTLVAALSLLLGVITALVASLTFALLGALGAVAGAFLPVVAGIGVLVAAIMSMDDATKKMLKDSMKPLVDEFKNLGKVAAGAVFSNAEKQADRLSKVMGDLEPLVRGVGEAISRVGDYFLDAVESPGFARFRDEMTEFLPEAVESLGRSFVNAMGGIGGLFVGLIPITQDFLGWLEKITGRFTTWANDTAPGGGADQIVQFFERAKESIKSVSGFLGEVLGLIGDLVDAGKDTGDSIFDDMADAVARFRTYIEDGKVEKWFEDAKTFADNLGTALGAASRLIDTLDNSVTRFLANGALFALGAAFTGVEFAIKGIIVAGALMLDVLKIAVGGVIVIAAAALKALLTPLQALDGFLGMFGGGIPGLDTLLDGLDAAATKGAEMATGFEITKGAIDMVGWAGTDMAAKVVAGAETSGAALSELTGQPYTIGVDAPGLPLVTGEALGLHGMLLAVTDPAWVAEVTENGMPVVQQKGDTLLGMLGLVSQIHNATITETGASQTQTAASNTVAGLQSIVNTYNANITSNAGSVYQTVLGLRGLLQQINDAKYQVNIGNGGGRTLGATGGVLMGNGVLATSSRMASGGMMSSQRVHRGVTVAEAGRELLVPVDRPLHMVDKSVRDLAAIAQGKAGYGGGDSRTVNVEAGAIQIVGPDPYAAAIAVMDEIVDREV